MRGMSVSTTIFGLAPANQYDYQLINSHYKKHIFHCVQMLDQFFRPHLPYTNARSMELVHAPEVPLCVNNWSLNCCVLNFLKLLDYVPQREVG